MFNIKTLRALIFNTSGPGKKNDVFYDLCKQFSSQQNKKKIQIKVGNLNNYRDFMHVDDVVRALYTISLKGQIGDNYNISSERLIRVSKIIDIFLDLAGNKKLFLIKKNFLYRKFDEKYIGNSSNIVCFSLHPTKNLGVFGDGGFISLNNKSYPSGNYLFKSLNQRLQVQGFQQFLN
jgi:nucleoside-diphosphate-sugar epimerase